ncbi:ADP-ribosylglycohydrolase family protein [Coraliomargarita sp. SDUM461004]|uniref:ADP-ribosylglycohydrolase family protein n=1 Tax=Thalassobacterium sedimentorum TaxID=3041258 RepID=A0ABU1AMY9_9BACT|nr:ADP-ribosylglycohydrolase family protein [Coraliomargarita sp. SDUM461004]MDQ8196168.1 ADP-ribosylglycohydrolase family protein [Coraliomargarita sp. SDUM461004]
MTQKVLMSIDRYREKMIGCWLGKAVGGTLGMPYEGYAGPLNLTFYDPVPEAMVANDDLDLQVLWACLLYQQNEPRVTPSLFIQGWRDHIDFPWDEYGCCKRNLADGLLPPLTGSFDNWFLNGMGAAIRSELWACLAPGDPALAAAYAREDACLDHAKEGLWAEVWLAALQSAAFVESDLYKVIDVGFEYIPEGSEIRFALEDTQEWWDVSHDWKEVRLRILEKYGHENFTNVTENLAFTLLALLDGDGDFSRSICTAVNCGKDTDCTAATVGALLGIMAPDSIGDEWLKPIGRDLVLSPEIVGITPPATLDDFTDLIADLRFRLAGKMPECSQSDMVPAGLCVEARIGSADVPWFGHGWQFAQTMHLGLPEMRKVKFAGTWVKYDTISIEQNAIFVEYTFSLAKPMYVRVMFNTHEDCRVFLDGEFAFARECGRMAPSPHRVPRNQAVDVELCEGMHTVVAVVKVPEPRAEIEWVVGVSDRNNNDQWLSGVFVAC